MMAPAFSSTPWPRRVAVGLVVLAMITEGSSVVAQPVPPSPSPHASSEAATPTPVRGPSTVMVYTTAGRIPAVFTSGGYSLGGQVMWAASDWAHVGLEFARSTQEHDGGHGTEDLVDSSLDVRAEAHTVPGGVADLWLGFAAGHWWHSFLSQDENVRHSEARLDWRLNAGVDLRLMLGRVNLLFGPGAGIGSAFLLSGGVRVGIGFR